MNPSTLADRVWQQTRPALRRRRITRRSLQTGAAALAIALVITSLIPAETPPEQPRTSASVAPATSPVTPSLALLVVDHNGARFQQFQPEELTAEGLQLDFTLDLVIGESATGYF